MKAVVLTCAHASPDSSNDRFTWLGKMLYDLKPDYVVDLGDGADMKSLNSYDTRKPEAIVSQNYEKDIECYNDAMYRLREVFSKQRRKRPAFFGFEGNHEARIKTALTFDPRLEGSKYGISFKSMRMAHLQSTAMMGLTMPTLLVQVTSVDRSAEFNMPSVLYRHDTDLLQ